MQISRNVLIAAAVAVVAVVAAFSVRANAQTAAGERIIGYSVYAHSHYVLIQRPDGQLKSCVRGRNTALNAPQWRCEVLGTLP
jgi:hypothetical protein